MRLRSGPEAGWTLKQPAFSEAPIGARLRQRETGVPSAGLCGGRGIGKAAFPARKARLGGIDGWEAGRPMALDGEDAKLDRLLSGAMRDNLAARLTATDNRLRNPVQFRRSPAAAPAQLHQSQPGDPPQQGDKPGSRHLAPGQGRL